MNDILKNEIRFLKGVGPKRAEAFLKLGVKTLGDLISYYPRSYEDRSIIKKINEIASSEKATVFATISNIESRRIRKNMHILKAIISDDTGYMNVVWFNQNYYSKILKNGKKYWFFGRVERKLFKEMTNPIFSDKFKDFAVIVPIYKKNSDLTQNIFRKSIRSILADKNVILNEIFSQKLLDKYNLETYKNAVKNIHYPENNDAFYRARNRLVFQEFFVLQLSLLLLKKIYGQDKTRGNKYISFGLSKKYLDSLSFKLTKAQIKVLEEIRNDFRNDRPMHRLLQGDVGSGKTAVAAAAIVDSFENGYQSAFMAPTEILAQQHYKNLKDIFSTLGMKTVYLGGDLKSVEKKKIYEKISNGTADVVIGTHALIQTNVEFNNLGFVITDEQHRFGVDQRKKLTEKGLAPHALILTATPIPRTLALILYGDLDISVIDEMPPHRKSIETFAITKEKIKRVLNFAEKTMKKGAQVYYVCPRIDDDKDSELISVEKVFEELTEIFSTYNVDLIHGRMKSLDKNRSMKKFYEGETNLLVSTTVIEVGVDVPNASLMIIDNAERFGLAQLHQLRGRVGRGSKQSYCILINRGKSDIAEKRMKVMAESADGFYISEQDLVIRGPGEFFGTRQHGLPEFKIANIYQDMNILKKAQKAAVDFLNDDPDLRSPENANIMVEINLLTAGYSRETI